MPRTLLPRSALKNSAAIASRDPVDPAIDEKILGPTSEPSSEPSTEPATEPSSEPGPKPPADPKPKILLVHPPPSSSAPASWVMPKGRSSPAIP
jgi:hypothetical protein